MGMIDFGNIYSNQISIRQGVREAARVGVVKSFWVLLHAQRLGLPRALG
jgi:hypothetical protein